MPKLTIDGVEIDVPAGTSVLQACEELGIEIPRFCYHDRLSVPANCRMCLVEMEKAPKLVASCAMPAGDGMVIHTKTDKVVQARKNVMEFMLIKHHLDCPICDQGGECDLQDQAVGYGYDRSRYAEPKRAVKDKDLGPLVSTVMTRCIQCTRCLRFGEEIAGINDMGLLNRGNDVEIGTYIEKAVESELSGNLVDVCPVGALTSKPYQYNARPWELRKTETIDVMDAVGSNVRVDARGREVLRVLPRLHEDVNEEWISDKTRYAYDGLKYQRLDKPYVRDEKGKLKTATWDEAFDKIAQTLSPLKGSEIAALVGDLADSESIKALKDLMTSLGVENLQCQLEGEDISLNDRSSYLFNSGISGLEQADAILLVGANPRVEATMVNARIKKQVLNRKIPVGLILGEQPDLTYAYEYLGAGAETLESLTKARSGFAKILKDAKNPMIILGDSVLKRSDSQAIQALASKLVDKVGAVSSDFNGYNILHTKASRVGALDLGFVGSKSIKEISKESSKGKIKALYLLGADEIDPKDFGETFIIYQGSHGDVGAHHADVILPGCAYTEKDGLYVNMEGRVQRARKAVSAPGEAKEDWKILRALSDVLGKSLPYNSLHEIRKAMVEQAPTFAEFDVLFTSEWKGVGVEGKTLKASFVSDIKNYYQTNVIARASKTMAQCTESFVETQNNKRKKA